MSIHFEHFRMNSCNKKLLYPHKLREFFSYAKRAVNLVTFRQFYNLHCGLFRHSSTVAFSASMAS